MTVPDTNTALLLEAAAYSEKGLIGRLAAALAAAEAQRDEALSIAERELDALRQEWMTGFDGSGVEWHESLPSPYTYKPADFSALVAAVHEYEARLANAEAAFDREREYGQRQADALKNCRDEVGAALARAAAAEAARDDVIALLNFGNANGESESIRAWCTLTLRALALLEDEA